MFNQETQSQKSEILADKVGQVLGSWKFLIIHTIFIAFWIILNLVLIASEAKITIDSQTFQILNLILAVESMTFMPLLLISQNRQEKRNQVRDDADFIADLKAEKLIEKIEFIIEELAKKDKLEIPKEKNIKVDEVLDGRIPLPKVIKV